MTDHEVMQLALVQARAAAETGEVPIGAVVLKDGEVIGLGCNAPIGQNDPTAHAEIVALRSAARYLGNYRLDGCELFVTLEPCPMCVGAMLHARLARVVFAASEPKTGAAGSVLDLFAEQRLNHHTRCTGGLLADESQALLQAFFQTRRLVQRSGVPERHPLREDALRTPEDRFVGLPGYPWQPRYLSDLRALDGLRLHYLDEGPRDADTTYLCLHGNLGWSYVYRKMIPTLVAAGCRVVAPDLVGFGKSDKPKKDSFHTFGRHRQILLELIERLDLRRVVLAVQGWGGILGLTLPQEEPSRWRGLLAMNTMLATGGELLGTGHLAWQRWFAPPSEVHLPQLIALANPVLSPQECLAYAAPFPDRGHHAALRRFPAMTPSSPEHDGAALSLLAQAFWHDRWQGPSMLVVGAQDAVFGLAVMQRLRSQIAGAGAPLVFEHAGHFVPEQGAEIAQAAMSHFPP